MQNGFVIYTGDQVTSFGNRLHAIPFFKLMGAYLNCRG